MILTCGKHVSQCDTPPLLSLFSPPYSFTLSFLLLPCSTYTFIIAPAQQGLCVVHRRQWDGGGGLGNRFLPGELTGQQAS